MKANKELIKKRTEERLKELKNLTKAVDGLDLIKLMFKLREKGSLEDKDTILSALHNSYEKAGEYCLERAFLENIITEKEWLQIKKKYKFSFSDMGVILLPVLNKQFNEDDKTILITLPTTKLFKHRKYIKKRFDVDVQSTEEFVKENKRIESNCRGKNDDYIMIAYHYVLKIISGD